MRRIVPSLLLVSSVAVVVAILYATLYPLQGGAPYSGFDTAWYVWRAKAVVAYGADVLPELMRPPFEVHPARLGHPLLAAFVASGTGVDPTRLAYGLPGVMGGVVGLSAGAFAVRVLREPPWAFPLYGIGVGGAVNMVLTSVGHADTLLVLSLVMAAALAALAATDGGEGGALGIVLLSAAAVTHLFFAALFGALLLALAVVLLPGSIAAKREGIPLPDTPSGRLVTVVGGAIAGGGGALLLVPGSPVAPALVGQTFAERIARDAGVYRLPLIAPLAAAGAVTLLLLRHPLRRRGLLFVVIWAASAAAASAAGLVFPVPVHRVLAFALGIPILVMAAISGAARGVVRLLPRWLGATTAAAIATAALGGSVWLARDGWRPMPLQRLEATRQAEVAGRYLQDVSGDRPVVFVIDPGGPRPVVRARLYFDTIKAALPAADVVRSHLYVGDARRLLKGGPTVDPGHPPYTGVSRQVWEGVRPVLDHDPIVLALDAFSRRDPSRGPHRATIEPGVTVISGPEPTGPIEASGPFGSPPLLSLTATVGALLVFLSMVGGGWSIALAPADLLTRIAMAPATGIAVLVLGGIAAGALGLDVPGPRTWVLAATTILGWGLAAVVGLRRTKRGREGGEEPF